MARSAFPACVDQRCRMTTVVDGHVRRARRRQGPGSARPIDASCLRRMSRRMTAPILTASRQRLDPPPRARVAAGRALRERVPRGEHARWSRSRSRPDVIAMLDASNRGPAALAGADPLRADAGLAVRLPARRGSHHGQRPGEHPTDRYLAADLRRRPSRQLRRVRYAGAQPDLRPERLRRDHRRVRGSGTSSDWRPA